MGEVTKYETPSPSTGLSRHVGRQPNTPNVAPKQHCVSESGYRVFSQDIPSDITVEAGGVSFRLHKFPLVSRSGRFRKLVAEKKDDDTSTVELPDMPGSAEAFETAAKFCYGMPFEIGAGNVVMLRCAAEYLEMAEDYSEGNLIHRSESYLKDTLTSGSLAMCVKILQSCVSLLPMSEDLDIVSRCIEATASKAFKEQAHPGVSDTERKRLCGLMDCRKLTQEACSHAAQNERLPVQTVVQVLYFEQVRLKSAMKPHQEQPDQQLQVGGGACLRNSQRSKTEINLLTFSPRNDELFAAVCRENCELKMEMARMRLQLNRPDQAGHVADVNNHGNGHASNPAYGASHASQQHPPSHPPTSGNHSKSSNNKFLSSVSKTLGKLNPFQRPLKDSTALSSSKPPESKPRRRRHSIS